MANEPKKKPATTKKKTSTYGEPVYGGKRRVHGGKTLIESSGPRKSRFGKAPDWIPAVMGGGPGIKHWGVSKLSPWLRKKFGQKPPKR